MKSEVADYFRETAAYRARLAEEKAPWHAAKNANYAISLERVAQYVESLSADDPSLQKLASCESLFEFGFFLVPSDAYWAKQSAIHCGPRGAVIDAAECAEWFADWVDCLVREAQEGGAA